MNAERYLADVEIAWCPGCGNFAIRRSLAQALAQLELPPHKVVLVTGIGQAAKIAHYVNVNGFNGLHGRTVAAAAGIKLVRPDLTVIAESGDGDLYGEGGNHLVHNIRRNVDLTVIAHDNRVYGLTKGQASPTAPQGYRTRAQPAGSPSAPLNPLALAIALDAPFVAQAFSGEIERTGELIAQAIRHKGFSLVNVLHPCPSWNRVQTFAWYRERIVHLEERGHDPADRAAAFAVATKGGEEIPIGVLYRGERPTFGDVHPVLQGEPLGLRPLPTLHELSPLLAGFA
ncbi:MAG: 2-oxoacid:ferredoxin oxidoreductase subunit beta [Candidatus Bipolaricaulota bacterium]|nr:2-oxoacid:ferredoxin oxidoreductase subunit beta [Candidatus Bipolaricaulota bacterium]